MRGWISAAAAVALVAIAAPASAARDWSAAVRQLPSGAFVLGNPNAPVKLVEYLSLTCSHCADFTARAWPPLKANYVRSGRVSVEVRHAIRDGYDLAASLLARCEGPNRYFAATEAYFARQSDWLGRASQAQIDTDGVAPEQLLPRLAAASGLDGLARARGLSPARVRQCLAAPGDRAKLTAMADQAWKQQQIGGTPAFLINGQLITDAHDWGSLEPRIRAALR